MDKIAYIYALINPITDSVFYIGATTDMKNRLNGHRFNYKSKVNARKNQVIAEIVENGLSLEMLELDSVPFCEATFYENFYMDLFRSYGFDLCQKRKSTYSEAEGLTKEWWQPPVKWQHGERNTTNILTEIFTSMFWYRTGGLTWSSYEAGRIKRRFYTEGLHDDVIAKIMRAHGYVLDVPKRGAIYEYKGSCPEVLASLGPDRRIEILTEYEGGNFPLPEKEYKKRGRPKKIVK